jgi:hypothetical protein
MLSHEWRQWWGGAVQPQKSFCLHWGAFIVAFAIGIAYVYLTVPQQRHVVQYPTPFNAGRTVFRDDAGTCFVFRAKQVSCPPDASKIATQPVIVEEKEDP